MLSISMFEHAFGAEHLLVTLTKELNLFVLMCVAILNAAVFSGTGCPRARAGIHL